MAKKIFSASSISVVSCDHGSVWVRLHGKDEKIQAYACMPKETALDLAQSILGEIDKIVARTAGDCETVH